MTTKRANTQNSDASDACFEITATSTNKFFESIFASLEKVTQENKEIAVFPRLDNVESRVTHVTHVTQPDLCARCTHHRHRGACRYCCGREDLPPAYGASHPLRILPDDFGRTCETFDLAEPWR